MWSQNILVAAMIHLFCARATFGMNSWKGTIVASFFWATTVTLGLLLTPILHETMDAERRFNRCHRKVRVGIKQAFGRLKCRFAFCMAKFAWRRACPVIAACCVLYNLALRRGKEDFPADDPPEVSVPVLREAAETGLAIRSRIVRDFFN